MNLNVTMNLNLQANVNRCKSKQNRKICALYNCKYLSNADIKCQSKLHNTKLKTKEITVFTINNYPTLYNEFIENSFYIIKEINQETDGCKRIYVIFYNIITEDEKKFYYPNIKNNLNNVKKFSHDKFIDFRVKSLNKININNDILEKFKWDFMKNKIILTNRHNRKKIIEKKIENNKINFILDNYYIVTTTQALYPLKELLPFGNIDILEKEINKFKKLDNYIINYDFIKLRNDLSQIDFSLIHTKPMSGLNPIYKDLSPKSKLKKKLTESSVYGIYFRLVKKKSINIIYNNNNVNFKSIRCLIFDIYIFLQYIINNSGNLYFNKHDFFGLILNDSIFLNNDID